MQVKWCYLSQITGNKPGTGASLWRYVAPVSSLLRQWVTDRPVENVVYVLWKCFQGNLGLRNPPTAHARHWISVRKAGCEETSGDVNGEWHDSSSSTQQLGKGKTWSGTCCTSGHEKVMNAKLNWNYLLSFVAFKYLIWMPSVTGLLHDCKSCHLLKGLCSQTVVRHGVSTKTRTRRGHTDGLQVGVVVNKVMKDVPWSPHPDSRHLSLGTSAFPPATERAWHFQGHDCDISIGLWRCLLRSVCWDAWSYLRITWAFAAGSKVPKGKVPQAGCAHVSSHCIKWERR